MTSIITPTKTLQSDLITLQNVAASTVVISSVVDMSAVIGGAVLARFGRRSASSGTAFCNIRLEMSNHASANNSWFPFAQFSSNYAAVEAEAVSGTVNAGTNVVTVASTTNLTVGTIVFIDNGTPANSEWGRIKAVSTNTSITLEDNLVNAQTGSTIYAGAEIFAPAAIPPEAKRIRAVVDGAAFTQNFAVQVSLITLDSWSAS